MTLTGPGAAPFHYFAKLRYTLDKSTLEGTYEVLWAAPDRYREEFRLGGLSATHVAVRDKLYILENPPALTYPHLRVRKLAEIIEKRPSQSQTHVRKTYASQRGSKNVVCADFGKLFTECFNPTTGELVSIERPAKAGSVGLTEDSFLSLGDARYPGHIVSTITNEVLEITVEELEGSPRFADDVFIRPTGSTSRDWCPQPEVKNEKDDSLLGWVTTADVTRNLTGNHGYYADAARDLMGFHGYYADVAPDGHIQRLAIIYLDGAAKEVPTKDIPPARLPTRTCGGQPIPYETANFARPVD